MRTTGGKRDLETAIRIYADLVGGWASRCPWENSEFYSQWLAQTYHYVRHTTRLLALAAVRTPLSESKLHERFLESAAIEEKGHERLAEADLARLGYDVANFEILPQTAFYYQSLEYLIENDGAVAIFGFSSVLEGVASLHMGCVLERVSKAHGPHAASFLKAHCAADAAHFDLNLNLMKVLNEESQKIMMNSARQCVAVFQSLVDALLVRSSHPTIAAQDAIP